MSDNHKYLFFTLYKKGYISSKEDIDTIENSNLSPLVIDCLVKMCSRIQDYEEFITNVTKETRVVNDLVVPTQLANKARFLLGI